VLGAMSIPRVRYAACLAPRALCCLLVLAALLLPAGVTSARNEADGSSASTPLGTRSTFSRSEDWRHLKLVLATLKVSPPKVPVVYLLGGSAAREATISDRSWTDQLKRRTGDRVRAFNLGTAGQSYDQDVAIIQNLPAVPGIVLIGVNLGRYTQPALTDPDAPATLPGGNPSPVAASLLFDYAQHRFTGKRICTLAKKRELLHNWLAERYPVFKRRYAYNERALARLIVTCQDRGLRPVLVNLPINRQLIGRALDVPCKKCAATSRSARFEFGIRSWDFVGDVHLENRDFVDLWHLVHSGRVKYQQRLSQRTAALLHEYGLTGTD